MLINPWAAPTVMRLGYGLHLQTRADQKKCVCVSVCVSVSGGGGVWLMCGSWTGMWATWQQAGGGQIGCQSRASHRRKRPEQSKKNYAGRQFLSLMTCAKNVTTERCQNHISSWSLQHLFTASIDHFIIMLIIMTQTQM